MDNQYIRNLSAQKRSVVKRIYGAVCLVLVASLLLTTSSFAWLTLSMAPEIKGMTSNIGANGNLEIALGINIRESAVGDSWDQVKVTQANRTWGNIIDLADESYGLQVITLRPTLLNAVGGAVNTLHPFAHPVYGEDGRVERIYANDMFAGTYNGECFVTAADGYGVRGIGTAKYVTPGMENTFGPLSQRQEVYYDACYNLSSMMYSNYRALCTSSQSILMAYCRDGIGVSASDFNLNHFSQSVDEVVSAANEELRLSFTLLAAAEMTPAENYFLAMDHLKEEYPSYETVQPLIGAAVQATGVADVGPAIAELRAFQDAAAQLKRVISSGTIDGSDGYSTDEIERTVGLIFDLEKTSFAEDSNETNYKFYSSVVSSLQYRKFKDASGWRFSYAGSSVNDMTDILHHKEMYQDNDSRENVTTHIYAQFAPIAKSLRLADLDQSIAGLYARHWSYWDNHAEEYQSLKDEVEALEAGLPLTKSELSDKKAQLQSLLDEKIYAANDGCMETIRSVMQDTIEAMQQYTLWSIAYYACDGQIPDDAYRRIQEMTNSFEYVHPRTVYQALCEYGVAPADALTQMLETYEKLERELLFLPDTYGIEGAISWNEVENELKRIFGTITHCFYFNGDHDNQENYSHDYRVEDSSYPIEVMERIREEIEACETAIGHAVTNKNAKHRIGYNGYQLWAEALGLLETFYNLAYPFDYGYSEYMLADRPFATDHDMYYSENFWFGVSIGVGSEDNFNESGLTVRQTRLQKAQENISNYQNRLIASVVNADEDMVALLMQLIAGKSGVSLSTISDYLVALQQQLEYGEDMMYQAALLMAASSYASDTTYRDVYSDSAPKDAAGLIALLQQRKFDEKVIDAFGHRMQLLDEQKALLKQSVTLLKKYQDPQTGDLTVEQIPAAEAVALLTPVLDTADMTLYGYVEEEQGPSGGFNKTNPPSYLRTVLYKGFGSPSVEINGKQAIVGGGEPVAIFGEVYLSLGRSLSGKLLAFAKSQVETYIPPSGSLSAEDIVSAELGMNRHAYAIGTGEDMFTLNLCTVDTPFALATDLWTYTGNTEYISANNILFDIYGYCIDLAFRTNAEKSDLLLQTQAVNRIYNGSDSLADTSMGAGSYMEFSIDHPSYTGDLAKEYMSCLRVVITDTKTGYIYGYAALDMNKAEVAGITIKAPLRLYDEDTGMMLEGDASQYICRLDQNVEKNLSVYVYLDGAKTSNALVSAYDVESLQGALNLQFCSSANLMPAHVNVGENSSNRQGEVSEDSEIR